jgi:hypothetical protein
MQETGLIDQNQWADEIRKADERCEQINQVVYELKR